MVDFCRQELDNRPTDTSGNAHFWEVLRRLSWIGLVVAVILIYAWIQAERLAVNYEISQQKQHNLQLQEEVSAVKVEHATLAAPDQIERWARGQGFVRLDEGVRILEAELPLFDPDRPMMASR